MGFLKNIGENSEKILYLNGILGVPEDFKGRIFKLLLLLLLLLFKFPVKNIGL